MANAINWARFVAILIKEFRQIIRRRFFKLYGCADEIENFVWKPADQFGFTVEVKIKLHGIDFGGRGNDAQTDGENFARCEAGGQTRDARKPLARKIGSAFGLGQTGEYSGLADVAG